jgi:hypothetical protein
MTSVRERVAAFWDAHVKAWLAGDVPLSPPLRDWFKAYNGAGIGKVDLEGFPEPFIGDLLGRYHEPRLVVLGLNPGAYRPPFQARDGIFAEEIRRCGSYTEWATTGPYHRGPWTDHMDNLYHRLRARFTRNWLEDPSADHRDLLVFECYPWHSTKLTAPLRPPPEIIEEFVWQPIAELPGVREVFAFGRPWNDLAQALRLPLIDKLGAGGSDYGSKVRSRAVRIYALPSGQRLIVEWHSAAAGPPSRKETEILRNALLGTGGAVASAWSPHAPGREKRSLTRISTGCE